MNLETAVQQELNTLITDGTLNTIIKTKLTSVLDDIIKSATQSYSDFGKRLKTTVEEQVLKINLKDFELVDYNHLVCTIIREQLDKTVYQNTVNQITSCIKEFTGFLDKKEWKLSEIIEKFLEEIKGDNPGEEGEITLEVKRERDWIWVSWDKEKHKNEYSCGYRLGLHNGKIRSFKGGLYIPHDGDLRKKDKPHGRFDSFLFNLYANAVTITIDEDDTTTEWYAYED